MRALQYTFAKCCSVAFSWVGKAVQKLVTDVHLDVESPHCNFVVVSLIAVNNVLMVYGFSNCNETDLSIL